MNVFKKLKDVLFDIEDEEIPVITKDEKKPVEEKNPIKEVKMPKEDFTDSFEPISEKPKTEPKFNFPLDFDEELTARNTANRKSFFDDEDDDYRSIRTSYRETKVKEEPKRSKSYDYDYSRLDINDTKKSEPSKPFKISPIISPVYGILDQNYTKDDVIVKSDVNSSKSPNLDDVRKKAYGTKKKVEEEIQDEFDEPLRTLDEILIDKEEVDEIISEDKPTLDKEPILDKNEPIGVYDDELPDEPYADEVQEEKLDKEDSIESDLFNLIDSMYEERNERVEEE